VIVIYMENWSFDGQFGLFPGANGITNAGETIRQVRKDGSPYTRLPQPLFNGQPDRRIPADLPVRPFDLAPYVPPDQLTGNPVHLFYGDCNRSTSGTDAPSLFPTPSNSELRVRLEPCQFPSPSALCGRFFVPSPEGESPEGADG
jgi:hypothetical protein